MKSPLLIKSVSFSPIFPWPVVAILGLAVFGLTVWAYRLRLRGTSGRWRWLAIALRMAAVLMCLLAAVRPALVIQQKAKQAASIVVLGDLSSSLQLTDEVGGRSRWDVAKKGLEAAREAGKTLGPDLGMKFFGFDSALRDLKADAQGPPDGKQTAIGTALSEAVKRLQGGRVASVLLFSDGTSNAGLAPLVAAQSLKSQQVPVYPVGLGSEKAGSSTRDIALREVVAGQNVFVKNILPVRGTFGIRGFPANEPVEVEMLVDDEKGGTEPVATVKVRPDGREVVPVKGLNYRPQTAGEKRVTLRIKPKEGELVRTNNEISTYVTVLKGGINVLYLQGRNFSWEYKFLTRALDASPDIRTDLKVIRQPAEGDRGEVEDAEFAPGRYDVYVLGDLPADFLTPRQQGMLVRAVEKTGAGLMMLGGRSSFGPGGWADTDVAGILPTRMHPGDGQIEPENGLKVLPNRQALDSYILRLGASQADSARLWEALPPIPGANRLGPPKTAATVFARAEDREPLMVGQNAGRGRTLAFAGETWVWARASEEAQLAHRKFWRQAIFWLLHKEDQGDESVKLALDRRRIAVGEKVELTATARDAKNEPIADAKFETTVVRVGPDPSAEDKPEPVDLFLQGEAARGSYLATDRTRPGEYRVTVIGRRRGKEIGRDSARFLVYQDDRELENPAADHQLLRQLAELTGGAFLTPEGLDKHLRALKSQTIVEDYKQEEHRVWDNWYFFLVFVTLLTLEWWLRKRHGWV